MSALALVGCEDAIVGKWVSKDTMKECSDGGEFEIEDNELTGDGSLMLWSYGCRTCSFDIEAQDKGDDEYDLEIKLDSCDINGSTELKLGCKFDVDTLECAVEKPPGLTLALYDDWDRKD